MSQNGSLTGFGSKGSKAACETQSSSYFPINKLPLDVLAKIFVQCLPDFKPRGTKNISSKCVAPLLLCNICFPWRALALSIPRLWQQLYLYVDIMKDKQNGTDLTDQWLKRSGTLPLTLILCVSGTLYMPDAQCKEIQTIFQALLRTLVNYASRWEHVYLSLIPCPPIPIPRFEPTPCLRAFSFFSSCSIPFPFSSCPKLTMIGWAPACDVSSPDVPWHQMTCIRLARISPSATLLLLRSCQNLEELAIDVEVEEEPVNRETVVTNYSLKRLCIHLCYESDETLLKKLILPALTELSCKLNMRRPQAYRGLAHFFRRSNCKLDRLQLHDFDEAVLVKCLRHASCASLTELSLVYNYNMFTDSVFNALTFTPTEEYNVLLPYLTRLSLRMCHPITPGILGTMISSRRQRKYRLKYLNFEGIRMDNQDYMLIKSAVSQGWLDCPYCSSYCSDDKYYF